MFPARVDRPSNAPALPLHHIEEALISAQQAAADAVSCASEVPNSWEALHKRVAKSNAQGMQCLRKGEAHEALRHLTQARELLSRAEKVCPEDCRDLLRRTQADTASNLGVFHRRGGNAALASRHLTQALALYEASGGEPRKALLAQLSLAACLLEAGMAQEALKQAQLAVEFGHRLVEVRNPQADDCAILAVAYHKVAEANEGLKDWSRASFAYTQAYEVVKRSLGPEHNLTRTFESSPRCPARPITPSIPPSLRRNAPPSTPKRLPNLSCARRGGTNHDVSSYKLDANTFPAWPPPTVSREEHAWYSLTEWPSEKQRRARFASPVFGGPSALGTL